MPSLGINAKAIALFNQRTALLNIFMTVALKAAQIMPVVDMARDFSEAAEAEAKIAASCLIGLGTLAGSSFSCLLAGGALAALSHPMAAIPFLGLSFLAAVGAYLCKRRLDVTKAKLEQLRAAALAARAARAVGSAAMGIASGASNAAGSVASGALRGLSRGARKLTTWVQSKTSSQPPSIGPNP